jgi:predicted transcriptional regulator
MTPNPLCKCGCGKEVSRPTHKYFIGHSIKRKLTPANREEIGKLRALGVSTYIIAEIYGVSQALISQLLNGYLYCGYVKQGAEIRRKEDFKQLEERKCLRQGKRTLKQIKKLLKKPGVWQ